MAHFAEIDDQNKVLRVIVIDNDKIIDDNGLENEKLGQDLCKNLFGGNWIQTSYNENFRKNFAGIDSIYDITRDAFILTKPYDSWVLDETTCRWIPPIPMPESEGILYWDESIQNWI